MHLKCGNKWHGTMQVPTNAEVNTSPAGRPFYVSGIDGEFAVIKFLDGKMEVKQVNRKLV